MEGEKRKKTCYIYVHVIYHLFSFLFNVYEYF